MAFYIITGKLRSGKSLIATAKMRDYLLAGRRVATNFDLYVENMLPVDMQKCDLTRLPDLPSADDLEALGQGSTGKYDEHQFGLIVLDEGSGNFNAREWADKGRQRMIDWLKHSGKLRWDVYIIVQSASMLDKQIREAFGEHLVTCKRMDRLSFPFIGPVLKLIGVNLKPPKVHVAVVRYGMGPNDPVVNRWFYRGTNLYAAYNTEQKFDRDTMYGNACYLSPYQVKGQYMNKFQIAKSIAAGYILGAFLLGLSISSVYAWWHYKASKNSLLTNGFASAKAFQPKDLSDSITVDGLMFVDGVAVGVLSDGRRVRTTEYNIDASGVRIKVGDKWFAKKG